MIFTDVFTNISGYTVIILLKTSIHRFKTRERKKKKKSVSSLQAVDCLRNKMDKENNYPFYN